MAQDCLNEADGTLIIYDVTSRSSFSNISNWTKQLKRESKSIENSIVIGNKCELEKDRAVSFEEGKELADSLGFTFMESSAKTAYNVKSAFRVLLTQIMYMRKDEY